MPKSTDKDPSYLPLPLILVFGAGNMANQIFDSGIQYIVLPVFNMALGVDPVLVGLAQSVARAVDLITDPLSGYLVDAWRDRIGLRSYLLGGSLVGGVAFALIWMVPSTSHSGASFAWLLTCFSVTTIAWSFFSVPRAALGIELTSDPIQRSRLMTIAGFMAIFCNFCLCWAYALTQWPVLGGTLNGARWVGGTMGAGIVGFGVITAIFLPRHQLPTTVPTRSRQPGWRDFGAALSRLYGCRSFRLLCLAYAITQIGLVAVDMGLLTYVVIYYVAGGSQPEGAVLLGAVATAWLLAALIVSGPVYWMSLRFGKKVTLLFFLSLTLVGSCLRWWFYNPAAPFIIVIPFALYGCGTGAFFLLAPAITADICDAEEAASGICDSGMFSAVFSWMAKLGTTLGTAATGILITQAGLAKVPHAMSAAAIVRMKTIDTAVPTIALIVGIALIACYRVPLVAEAGSEAMTNPPTK